MNIKSKPGSYDLNTIKKEADPFSEPAGLRSKSGAAVPLRSVHIKARIVDVVAEVFLFQEFYNDSDDPIEAKYVFPLDEFSSVCGFEAFIEGKHIVGEVKPKEKAHKEYKEAVERGDGAYLMDESEEKPDVFTVSVGNLPPKTTVIIKITYVSELQMQNTTVTFRIPASVSPADSLKSYELTQAVQSTVVANAAEKMSLEVSVKSASYIRNLVSSSHKIEVKRTTSNAAVRLLPGSTLTTDFVLLIGLALRFHASKLIFRYSCLPRTAFVG